MEMQNMENNNLGEQNINDVSVNNSTSTENVVEKKEKKGFQIKTFRKMILTILLILGIVFIAYLAFKKITYKEKIDLKAIPTYNVTHIKIGQIHKEYEANGTILPNDTFYVTAKVGGDIKKIYVSNGDRVKKGDPICDIDASKEIEAAFIEYDTAKKNFERMQKLYMAGDISQQNYEQVKALYDGKKLAYDTKVEYSTVVAVDDGVIENTDMIINTSIKAEKVLCYITSNKAKEINFGITERALSGISLGDKVVIEKSGKKYDGRITNISKLVDSKDGLFHQKAVILSENNFAAGVNAKVIFTYDRRINVQILPNDTIGYETGQAYIYVVDENNIIRKKYIEVGMQDEYISEILTKIDKKEKIVSTWTKDLAEGSQAKIGIDEEVIDDIVKETEKSIETIVENKISTNSVVESESLFENENLGIDETLVSNDETVEIKIITDEVVVEENEKGDIIINESVNEFEITNNNDDEKNVDNSNNDIDLESESVKMPFNTSGLRDSMVINSDIASFSEVK